MSLAETYMMLFRQLNSGGGEPPVASWDDELAALNPIYSFPLTEASGNFANIGSRSGTVPTGTAQGTPVYQAGSFIAPSTGIGVQSGDGFNYSASPSAGSTTVVLLIKPPATLANVDFVNSGGSVLLLRCLSDGTLRMYDDIDATTVSSAAGVLKTDEYNLIFYQPLIAGASKIYHTSETAGGTVTEVASGAPFSAQMETTTLVRGSSNADTAIIEAYAVIQGALDLSEMQALADTLTWA